jgi:hypothetical protein
MRSTSEKSTNAMGERWGSAGSPRRSPSHLVDFFFSEFVKMDFVAFTAAGTAKFDGAIANRPVHLQLSLHTWRHHRSPTRMPGGAARSCTTRSVCHFPRAVALQWAALVAVCLGQQLALWNTASAAVDSDAAKEQSAFGVFTDDVVLAYQGVLGKGSYKTVYSVSSPALEGRWALAVERLPDKETALEELRGISISQQLESIVPPAQRNLFEHIESWWLQYVPVEPFAPDARVQKSEDPPTRFTNLPPRLVRPLWLVSLKPVYDMDLETFRRSAPVSGVDSPLLPKPANSTPPSSVGGVTLDDKGAIQLALDLMTAGRILHEHDLIHRDIKPKNIMLLHGRAVLIDFGYTQKVCVCVCACVCVCVCVGVGVQFLNLIRRWRVAC